MTRLTVLLAAGISALALSSAAQAADLIIEEEPIIGVVEAESDWEGPYIGVFGGMGWGVLDHIPDGGPCAPDGCDIDMSGWLLGVTAGANVAVSDGIIAGIAGDIAWSNVYGDDDSAVGYIEGMINWEGSVRGVLGFDGGAFMPYVTGGLAIANATHTNDMPESDDVTHFGWTAGVGVAIAATEDVSIDLQYRYSDYNDAEYDMNFAPNNPVFDLREHRVTVGVNFHL